MRNSPLLKLTFLALAILLLPACATVPAETPAAADSDRQQIARLNRDILALGDNIDPREARLAATVAIRATRAYSACVTLSGVPLISKLS